MKQTESKTNANAEQDLVVERIKALPINIKISIGSGYYSKDELIGHVKNDDSIGKKITQVQLEYLRSLKEGIFFDE